MLSFSVLCWVDVSRKLCGLAVDGLSPGKALARMPLPSALPGITVPGEPGARGTAGLAGLRKHSGCAAALPGKAQRPKKVFGDRTPAPAVQNAVSGRAPCVATVWKLV